MKHIIILASILFYTHTFGQNISSVNSGAISNNDLVYTVGEIFVISSNSDEASSGIIGVISNYEFVVSGIDDILYTAEIKVFPNPTKDFLTIQTQNLDIKQITVYNNLGQVVLKHSLNGKVINLEKLNTGTYLVITDNPNIKPFKIIKR